MNQDSRATGIELQLNISHKLASKENCPSYFSIYPRTAELMGAFKAASCYKLASSKSPL